MSGESINSLQQGLNTFKEALQVDDLAAHRIEVAVVTFFVISSLGVWNGSYQKPWNWRKTNK